MGLGGISIWQLLIVLLIVVVLFGTKRLRSLGGDLGSAVKGFKKAVSDDDKAKESAAEPDPLLHSDSTSAKNDEPAREKPSSEHKAR